MSGTNPKPNAWYIGTHIKTIWCPKSSPTCITIVTILGWILVLDKFNPCNIHIGSIYNQAVSNEHGALMSPTWIRNFYHVYFPEDLDYLYLRIVMWLIWSWSAVTWNVRCNYVQALAQRAPNCCVAFSAFYNNTIMPCPDCSCACMSNLTSVASLSAAAAASDSHRQMCVDP